MNTPLYDIWRVEYKMLLTRKSAKCLMGLAFLGGVAAPLTMLKLQGLIDSRVVQAAIGQNVAISLMRSLALYNLIIAPLMLSIISAQCLAGEWRDKQLQNALIAPFSRWALISAKTMAICTISAIALIFMFIPTFVISYIKYSSMGPMGQASIAVGLSLLSHAMIAGISFFIATKTQKVWLCTIATLSVLFFFICLHIILKVPALFLPESMKELGPKIAIWMPWDWMQSWSGWKAGFGHAPTRLSLGLLGFFAALKYRFNHVDVD